MYANLTTQHRSKFCHNCGALIHIQAKDSKPELCDECAPYKRILDDCNSQIEQAKGRMRDAYLRLDEIAATTRSALRDLMLRQ